MPGENRLGVKEITLVGAPVHEKLYDPLSARSIMWLCTRRRSQQAGQSNRSQATTGLLQPAASRKILERLIHDLIDEEELATSEQSLSIALPILTIRGLLPSKKRPRKGDLILRDRPTI